MRWKQTNNTVKDKKYILSRHLTQVHDTILKLLWTNSIYWCHYDNENDNIFSLTGHRLVNSESLNPSYVRHNIPLKTPK